MTTLPTTIASGSSGHLEHHEEVHKSHNGGILIWFYNSGNATVSTGIGRIRPGFACELIDCFLDAGTAPTGANLIANVRKNGVAILAGAARPRILAGATSGAAASFTTTTLDADDYLTGDIDQIGSTVAGANVTLGVRLRAI